jgi:hypothetical protein
MDWTQKIRCHSPRQPAEANPADRWTETRERVPKWNLVDSRAPGEQGQSLSGPTVLPRGPSRGLVFADRLVPISPQPVVLSR